MTADHHDPLGGAHPTGPDANLEDEYQIVSPGSTATDSPTASKAQPTPPDGDDREDAVDSPTDAATE
ncbi:hypothetical protein [Naasia lichenicola]|uniref:Uncharacterized protein n=1 Tax=Naasia lichenicola TaxID=2565933 RepID=A0A4S4FNM8_9MICO|nr:hypothetical protein [Naasia lichenicola]THG31851.1 hypothetical protein E6C64_07320 [Naasia lichenicola]